MREMQLSPRLAAVAEKIPLHCRLGDVGTDHGRLPIWLIRHDRVQSVIASDLRKGPLSQARENGEKYHVSHRLELRLCSGLEGYRPEEVDAISICGMGGETIRNILAAAPWSREKQLILQPQSNYAVLRRFLQEKGYVIQRESLVLDREHLYSILEVTAGEMAPLTPGEAYGGRVQDWETDPLRGRFLRQLIAQFTRELAGLERSSQPDDVPRREDLRAALAELQERERTLTW